jgi:uncharacterized protein (TIGR02594 family)
VSGDLLERTPRWFEIAYAELLRDVTEVTGAEHNLRILQYHDTTTLDASTDEVPWCSSFVNWVFAQADQQRTRSARARSWLDWGIPQGVPLLGSVVVLKRGSGPQPGPTVLDAPGHVGFFAGFTARGGGAGRLVLLGGNQGDRVSLREYPILNTLGYRWPF